MTVGVRRSSGVKKPIVGFETTVQPLKGCGLFAPKQFESVGEQENVSIDGGTV
jgi:hypothetical protein